MLSKVKIPVSDKPKHYTLDQVPDVLGSNFYGFERLKLLSSAGTIAVRYKNAGSLLVGNVTERELKTYKNTSPILIWEIAPPCIYTIHENDTLQILNYETGSCDTVTFSSKATSLKKTQAILVFETTIFCTTAQTVLIWDRNSIKTPPREIILADSKDKSTRIIININHSYSSALSANRLLLANNDVFQVWNIDKEKQEMYMEFEGRNPTSTVKNLNVWSYGNSVVTFNRETTSIYSINKPKEKEKNPKEIHDENIFTHTYIDDSLIITGDNLGGLCLRQNDGEKLYDLVEPTNGVVVKKDAMEFNVENKVNVITKLGRWIFVGFNNSKVSVFDLFKEKSGPVLEYISPKPGSVNSLLLDGNTLLATFKQSKSKANAKEKPEIIAWAPKLPGLDYYVDANKDGKDSIICVVAYTRRQISSYLEGIKNAGEEITELSTTTDHLGDCIEQIYRAPEFAVQFFQAIKKLQTSLDSFESLLEKLNQSGRLVRIFTSSRLRRDIEYQNSVVGNNVMDLEVRLKTAIERRRPSVTSKPAGFDAPVAASNSVKLNNTERRTSSIPIPARESMITDPAGREFWNSNWGNALHVPLDAFLSALHTLFPTFSPQQEQQISQILDFSNTGSVSQYKFAEFLKGFGPFESCVTNVSKILSETWFHGFLSGRESELLMKNLVEPDGTFLVRFSKSKPGSFALAFLKDSVVNHILIESCMPEGYKILTQDTTGSARMFKSLYELIFHYNYVLQIPMICDIPKADWFHGDITTDEANELLRDKSSGTFLVRFSSKGTFAASFVDSMRVVRHVLINTEGKNHYLVDTGSGLVAFKSIRELVAFYSEKQVFVHPLVSGK